MDPRKEVIVVAFLHVVLMSEISFDLFRCNHIICVDKNESRNLVSEISFNPFSTIFFLLFSFFFPFIFNYCISLI